MLFTIQGFAALPDKEHATPPIFCHGHRWCILFYPNGDATDKKKFVDGTIYVSVFLRCDDAENGETESFRAKPLLRFGPDLSKGFGNPLPSFSKETPAYGWFGSFTRDQILRACNADGSLPVKVDLQVDERDIVSWKPAPSMLRKIANLYETKAATDIDFVFAGGHRIKAHRFILAAHDSHLGGLSDDDSSGTTEIHLTGEDPRLFEIIIRFLYTESLPEDFDDQADAISVLKLADKHGFADLKMLMEARISESKDIITEESAVEILIVAESHNCALLKEAAMKVVVDEMPHIIGKNGWDDLLQWPDLANEVFNTQAKRSRPDENADDLDRLGVSALRSRAADAGLEVDGSREVLIKRLKETENES